MSDSPIDANGTALSIGDTRVVMPPLKSFHRVPGLENAWAPAGIIDGHFVNLDPDDWPQGGPGGPGGKAGLYQDIGTNNYTITFIQEFNAVEGVYVQAAPLVCIDLDDPRFGLALWYESEIFGGTWLIWEIGRIPEDIWIHVNTETGQQCVENDPGLVPLHGDYTQLELKMEVNNGRIRAFGEGKLRFDFPIPPELVNSTLVGMSIDIGAFPYRPPDVPCALAPYTLETRAPTFVED